MSRNLALGGPVNLFEAVRFGLIGRLYNSPVIKAVLSYYRPITIADSVHDSFKLSLQEALEDVHET